MYGAVCALLSEHTQQYTKKASNWKAIHPAREKSLWKFPSLRADIAKEATAGVVLYYYKSINNGPVAERDTIFPPCDVQSLAANLLCF